MRFVVYTSHVSYKDEFQPQFKLVGSETPMFLRQVNAVSRLEAFNKCLDDIRKEFPKVKGKYLSVYVGKLRGPNKANRMVPFQIDISTGNLR